MDNIIKVRVPEYTKFVELQVNVKLFCEHLDMVMLKFMGQEVHTQQKYISKEERERFRNELLHKTVQGISSRKFFFTKCIHPLRKPDEFVVNYIR